MPWGPPPVRKRSKVKVVLLVLLVLALVAATIGVVVFVTRDTGPEHPEKWDPKVQSIVDFVEKERDLDFEQPVYVDFLTPAEYSKATAGDEEEEDPAAPSADEVKAAEQQVAQFRALGLVEGKVDLLSAYREVSDTGTLAFYSPEKERIIVRGTKLTPGLRVTLAHELTHALQDQHFDIERITELQGVDDTLLRSVVEGDATNVEGAFVEKVLTSAEREEYAQDSQDEGKAASDKLEETVPDVLLAGFEAPYLFGPTFTETIRADKGDKGVNDAIVTPPASLEQLIDPLVFIAGQPPKTVEAPGLPDGATRLDSGPFGSIDWFLMLSERIDAHTALKAIDGWGGDQQITYEDKGGKVCVEVNFEGDTAKDSIEMLAAIKAWQFSMPKGVTDVSEIGDRVHLKTCDAGEKAKLNVTGRASKALVLPAVRQQVLAASLTNGATREQAGCYANALVDRLTVEQLSDQEKLVTSPAFMLTVAEAQKSCR